MKLQHPAPCETESARPPPLVEHGCYVTFHRNKFSTYRQLCQQNLFATRFSALQVLVVDLLHDFGGAFGFLGGGGRIAFGVRLTEEELSTLAATGELPSGSKTDVGGEEEFLADYPGTSISIEGGQAANEPDEPLEVCRGSFRFLVGSKKSHTVILLR